MYLFNFNYLLHKVSRNHHQMQCPTMPNAQAQCFCNEIIIIKHFLLWSCLRLCLFSYGHVWVTFVFKEGAPSSMSLTRLGLCLSIQCGPLCFCYLHSILLHGFDGSWIDPKGKMKKATQPPWPFLQMKGANNKGTKPTPYLCMGLTAHELTQKAKRKKQPGLHGHSYRGKGKKKKKKKWRNQAHSILVHGFDSSWIDP